MLLHVGQRACLQAHSTDCTAIWRKPPACKINAFSLVVRYPGTLWEQGGLDGSLGTWILKDSQLVSSACTQASAMLIRLGASGSAWQSSRVKQGSNSAPIGATPLPTAKAGLSMLQAMQATLLALAEQCEVLAALPYMGTS